MKITLDGKTYNLNLSKLIELERQMYVKAMEEGVRTPDGKVHQIKGKSLVRTALKMLMTPIVIPLINSLYADRGIILDEPERHADLIDYSVHSFLDYMCIVEREMHGHFTSEIDENSEYTIKSFVTAREGSPLLTGPADKDSTTDPGREALVDSRENWHGQNNAYTSDNQEENTSKSLS